VPALADQATALVVGVGVVEVVLPVPVVAVWKNAGGCFASRVKQQQQHRHQKLPPPQQYQHRYRELPPPKQYQQR